MKTVGAIGIVTGAVVAMPFELAGGVGVISA